METYYYKQAGSPDAVLICDSICHNYEHNGG